MTAARSTTEATLRAGAPFLFMRHGETEYNRRHVRCGGDVDIPLTEEGEAQALRAAEAAIERLVEIDVIIASPLIRTRRTAEIVAERLAGRPVLFHDGLIERRLGSWNGQTIDATQADLAAGRTPPGGEAEMDFQARIARTLNNIMGQSYRFPLLVGSKGVGRILTLLLAQSPRSAIGNAEIVPFTFHGPVAVPTAVAEDAPS